MQREPLKRDWPAVPLSPSAVRSTAVGYFFVSFVKVLSNQTIGIAKAIILITRKR